MVFFKENAEVMFTSNVAIGDGYCFEEWCLAKRTVVLSDPIATDALAKVELSIKLIP